MKGEERPNRRPRRVAWAVILVLLSLLWASCAKKTETPTGPNTNPPVGMAQVTGRIQGAAGQPVADVAVHIVYEFTGQGRAAHLDEPSATWFRNEVPLTTECGGSTPLSDGVMVKLYWDRNGNGPDDSDEPPPLCDHPLNCDDGPAETVNLIEFPINGQALGIGAGLFDTNPGLVTTGDILHPNRFYARIFCLDGNVMYTSNVVEPPQGPSDMILTFTCTPCNGVPAAPEWFLSQTYPNPALDTVTVPFGLETAGNALVLLNWLTGHESDTLFLGNLGSGGHEIPADLARRPNGLYQVQLISGGYSATHTLLRNVTDYVHLQDIYPAAVTLGDGTFELNAAASEVIDLRDSLGTSQGTAELARLKVVAMKSGYATADTTFEVSSGATFTINLTLYQLP